MMGSLQALTLPTGSLKQIIGEPMFRQVQTAATRLGHPPQTFERLHPLGAALMLAMPPSTSPVLDERLYSSAIKQGKQVCGLESASESLSEAGNIPMPDQVKLLEMTLDALPMQDKLLPQMVDAYVARDLRELVRIAVLEQNPTESPVVNQFMYKLIVVRNKRMVDRMQPHLLRGRALIAVGALHLPGEQGILRRLQRRGYRITALY